MSDEPDSSPSGRIGKTSGEFSVCQFFIDGNYEYVRRWVSDSEAITAFKHYTNNVAVRMGIITRVIVTDGGDAVAAEWQHGKGLTWPKPDTLVDPE
jgi:hypothetical protein